MRFRGFLRQKSAFFLIAGLPLVLLLFGTLYFSTRFVEPVGGVSPVSSGRPLLQRVVIAAFFLFVACFLYLYSRYLKPMESAANILDDALEKHGADRSDEIDPLKAAKAIRDRLDRYAVESERSVRELKDEWERRLRKMDEENRDLLTHHKLTKKMLQSVRSEEVYETLLYGTRRGLGFAGAVLGLLDSSGELRFQGVDELGEHPVVQVSAWSQQSLLARTLWSGTNLFVDSLATHEHTKEDRIVIGDGAAFLVTIERKQSAKEGEVKDEAQTACPLARTGSRCWAQGNPKLSDTATPEERRKGCAMCGEGFRPSAVLVVRDRHEPGKVTREAVAPIVTLAEEATLALEFVSLHEDLQKMAVTDGLTGLLNHREFYQSLRRELERARRYRHTVSLLIIDIDNFKQFNDRFGHQSGDRALQEVAALLRDCARASDIICRYGGEEFAVILPESTPGGALMLAERVKTEVAKHDFMPVQAGGIHLTVSIGIYSSIGGVDSEDQVVSFADEAAYRAKHGGKNQVVVRSHA